MPPNKQRGGILIASPHSLHQQQECIVTPVWPDDLR